MQQPHEVVWFVVALSAGVGMLGLVLTDVWRPQVRGVLARRWTHQWWRGLMTCVALGSLGGAWRAWTGTAALPGWGEVIRAIVAILGIVCLIGLVTSMTRQ